MRKLLKDEFPEIFNEIDLDKTNVDINTLTFRSNQIIYWKCSNNHSWKANINSRTRKNKAGCPYCSGRKVLKGYNDLQTLFPDLCKEWNYDRNDLNPDEVTKCSGKKVWWKCKNNHEWESVISSRSSRGTGCQYCKKKST